MSLIVEIRREPGRTTIILRPYPRWRVAAGFAAVAMVAAALGLLPGPASVILGAFQVLLVSLFAVATSGALLALAWVRFGREIIVAREDFVSIEHRLFQPGRRVRTFAADRVKDVRAVGLGQVMRGGRPVSAIAPALAFDYEGQSVRFGGGLAGAEAESVVEALLDGVRGPRRGPSP